MFKAITTQYVLFLLSSLFIWSSAAQDPGQGWFSTRFDPKYIPYKELLTTPITHPGLFSFTGRWHRNRQTFTASAWPGTYVTSLVYGERCVLKLKPLPKGVEKNYCFYVSVDGGDDMLYSLPTFDSKDPKYESIFVGIKIPKGVNAASEDSNKILRPHTVRIVSVPETPFSFEGLLVTNTLVRQGMTWAERQDERTYVEFVGEGVDAETQGGLLGWTEEKSTRQTEKGGEEEYLTGEMKHEIKNGASLLNSVQYRVADALGFRHTHISTSTCLVSDCDSENPLPGLAEQYFYEEPIPAEVNAKALAKGTAAWKQSLQQQWPFTGKNPWVNAVAPSYVLVDVGIRDLLIKSSAATDEKAYSRALMVFLAKMRRNARPNAAIMVVARDPDRGPSRLSGPGMHSIIPADSNSKEARRALFRATKTAVESVREDDPNIFLLPINPSRSPFMDLATALCASMVEPFVPSTTSLQYPTRAQNFCRHIKAPQHRIIPILTPLQLSLKNNLPNNLGGNKETKHLMPPNPHSQHEPMPSRGFVTLYAIALCIFAGVLAYLLAKPILLMLSRIGWSVPGQKRVFGVRGDTESGAVDFGIGRKISKGKRDRGTKGDDAKGQ